MMLLLVFASFTTWSVIPSSWGFQSSVFFGVMIGGSETSTYVRAQRATSECEGSALAQSISLTLLHRAGCYEPSATVPADVSNYGTCTGWDGHDKGCGDEHQPAGDVKLGLGANVSIDGTGSGQVVGRDGCGQGYGNELQPAGSVENVLRANAPVDADGGDDDLSSEDNKTYNKIYDIQSMCIDEHGANHYNIDKDAEVLPDAAGGRVGGDDSGPNCKPNMYVRLISCERLRALKKGGTRAPLLRGKRASGQARDCCPGETPRPAGPPSLTLLR